MKRGVINNKDLDISAQEFLDVDLNFLHSENRKAKFNYFKNKRVENLHIFHFGTENSMLTEEERMFIIPSAQPNTLSTELSHLSTNVQSQVQDIVKEYQAL